MTALPRALARWEAELAWLPPALAPALGAMIPRLALAIGPLARTRKDTGEPDGYGRIARKGPFDRMLASQWALLDEVPEDFLRRASTNELLFFELARSEPRGGERSIALFDAGPATLGAPRIAHLALLVVLARRAAEAGVPFSWGTLRAPTLRPFVGEASVRELLGARTPYRVTDEGIASLRQALALGAPPGGRGRDDVFVAGDGAGVARLRESLGVPVSAAVHDTSFGAPRDALAVTVSLPRAAPKRLVLPLPDEPTRVRLLRDPYRAAERPPPATPERRPTAAPWRAPIDPLDDPAVVFSRDGRKVFFRAAVNRVLGVALPEANQPGRVFTRFLSQGDTVLAVGGSGRRVLQIVREASGVVRLREAVGGSRDLDAVELKGRGSLGSGAELSALAQGLLSLPSEPLDVVVRTRMGLCIWRKALSKPLVVPAHACVPLASGPQGLAVARRAREASAGSWVLPGYAAVETGGGAGAGAVIARAPDDSLVAVLRGDTSASSSDVVARATKLLDRRFSDAFLPILEIRDEGDPAIVTEHVEAPTLTSLLARARSRGARLTVEVACALVRELAEAAQSLLDAGHPRHRSLRPGIVRVTSDGRLRVELDLRFVQSVTGPGPTADELGYLAPELIAESNGTRADVFALGAMLHELLGGAHPTGTDDPYARLTALSEGRLVPLASLVPDLAPELDAIVRTATARALADRFESPGALAIALRRFRSSASAEELARERAAALALDEEATTRRQLSSPWDLVVFRRVDDVSRDDFGSEVGRAPQAAALRVVVGGTSGGTGLVGFVEPDRVRVVTPSGQYAEQSVAIPRGADVVGVVGPSQVVVRASDAVQLIGPEGVVASFSVPVTARLTMSPGWPHLAVTARGAPLRVLSLAERRELVVGGDAK